MRIPEVVGIAMFLVICQPEGTMACLRGFFRILLCVDVAEEIALDDVRTLPGIEKPGREPSFRPPTPAYVGFERPPVVERIHSVRTSTGQDLPARLKSFNYGVVSLALQYPFECEWKDLIDLSSRWIGAPEREQIAL